MKTLEDMLSEKFFNYLNTHHFTSFISSVTMARMAMETMEEFRALEDERRYELERANAN